MTEAGSASADYADWRALNRRRQTALRERLCTVCAFIWRADDPGPRPVAAVCEWTTPVGNRELLCAYCLECWQGNATGDAALRPAQLVML